jgi:hypothetical protein
MTYQNDTRPQGGAAGLGENAFPGGNCSSETAPKADLTQAQNDPASGQFTPQPFPTFFELVTQNAEAPMRRAFVYLRICEELGSIGDYDAFCEAGDKFLDAGREFAKLLSLLKSPTIFSNENADRLEEKALALHNLADLTEMKAGRIREVVAP